MIKSDQTWSNLEILEEKKGSFSNVKIDSKEDICKYL